jgi:tetratricopeptide (TPR) repeat protein
VAMIAIFCAASSVCAQQNSAFAKANENYNAGRFQEAVDGYQELVRSGQWNANLFYDLGNAWFRLGNFGQAILNYERALALEPHHPEAEANLRIARDEGRALELTKNWIERYLAVGTTTQYCIAASIAFWLVLFIVAHLIFSRRRSSGLIAFLVFCLLIFAGAVFAVYSIETGNRGEALAIVIDKNIEARLATADNANSVLALPPGSEIKVLSQRGDWTYAELPNDLRGWIPAKSAALVRL